MEKYELQKNITAKKIDSTGRWTIITGHWVLAWHIPFLSIEQAPVDNLSNYSLLIVHSPKAKDKECLWNPKTFARAKVEKDRSIYSKQMTPTHGLNTTK